MKHYDAPTLLAPLIQAQQASAPPTPAAGYSTGVYFKTDGLPYYLTPSGTEVPFNVGDVQTSLHLNPSFEVWGPPLTNWDTFWQVNSSVTTETTDVFSGTRSLTITNNSGATGNNQLVMSSVFGVASGDIINAAVWARAVSGNATLIVGIMTAASGSPAPFDGVSTAQGSDTYPLSSAFAKYAKTFTVPAGHAVCRLTFRVACADTAGSVARLDASTSSKSGSAPSVLPGGSWPKEAVKCVDIGTSIPTSTAPSTVDSVSLAVGDRVLKAIPGGHANNGIYTVVTVGTGANGVWARAADAGTALQLAAAETGVLTGIVYGGTRWGALWRSTDTLGTTSMLWTQIPLPDSNGWVTATLNAGAPYGGGFVAPRYRLLNGIVYVQGLIQCNTTVAANTTFFTLPAGMRPSATLLLTTQQAAGLNRIDVANTGGVSTQSGVAAGNWISINIPPFPADL
jgi:hypothetical protein